MCHVEKFQIYIYERCGEIWNFSRCRVISNFSTWHIFLHISNLWYLWQISGMDPHHQSRWRIPFQVAPLLTPSLHLVALDLPGHGRSAHLPPGNSQWTTISTSALQASITTTWSTLQPSEQLSHKCLGPASPFLAIPWGSTVNQIIKLSTHQKKLCLWILSQFSLGRPCSPLCSCFPWGNWVPCDDWHGWDAS